MTFYCSRGISESGRWFFDDSYRGQARGFKYSAVGIAIVGASLMTRSRIAARFDVRDGRQFTTARRFTTSRQFIVGRVLWLHAGHVRTGLHSQLQIIRHHRGNQVLQSCEN